MSALFYHVAKSESWERESRGGEYRSPSLETEGFIHCSLAEQVPETLEINGPLNRDAVVAVRRPPQIKKNPE